MVKVCCFCKQEKKECEFSKNSSKVDGLQTMCKACNSYRCKARYKTHGPRMREQIKVATKIRRGALIEHVLHYLYKNPCVDCGESDVLVLEFDHVRGKKKMAISQMVSGEYTKRLIDEEIAKCDVRCANCHRRRTAKYQHTQVMAAIERINGSKVL